MLPGEIDATVIFYGHLETGRDALAAIAAPVLGIFGAEDGGIPVATVREFESTLRDLGKDVRIHVYEGADHAFANPSGGNYHAEAAADAWAKTLAFFAETLR
jgi:carboxymethylenebutenolidase